AVKPYPSNPRKAPPKAVDAVARSIERFGWRQPIVVDAAGVVIVGHTRLLAARKLGLAQVPVHVADMPESEARAYRVADNQTGFLTSWDDDLLTQELLAIKDDGIDLDVLAFKEGEIARLLAEPVVEDEVPEPPADPVTKPGDLWLLGEHRLLCGDSTRAEDWDRLGICQNAVCFTSPPYNLGDAFRLRGTGKSNAYDQHDDNVSAYAGFLDAIAGAALERCPVAVVNLQPVAGCKHELLKWVGRNAERVCDIVTWD